jgi:hypothetical protein
MGVVIGVPFFVRALLSSRTALAAENLALRRQLAVLKVSVKRPRLRRNGLHRRNTRTARDRRAPAWLAVKHLARPAAQRCACPQRYAG